MHFFQRIDGFEFSGTEVLKPEHLLFATEIFFSIGVRCFQEAVFLIIMVPAVASQSINNYFWRDVLSLFPHGAIMGYDYLTTYVLYQFGSRVYSPFEIFRQTF